jgi:transposase
MEGKGGKNDATAAAAICEAASWPSMRFVPVKTCEQQGVMSLHRVREGLKEELTACINVRALARTRRAPALMRPAGRSTRARQPSGQARGQGHRDRRTRSVSADGWRG